MIRSIFRFYKLRISPMFAPCCRFHPTCSEYALLCFLESNFLSASMKTILRILRCNPLCRGGIDYPIVSIKTKNLLKNLVFKKINIDIWLVPAGKNRFYLIKSLKDKH